MNYEPAATAITPGHSSPCIDYAGTHARARHPESEAGVDIGPGEQVELAGKATRLRGVA